MDSPDSKDNGLICGLLDKLSSLVMLICGINLVILIVIFGWLVFGRYVLNVTPTWVEQVALLIIVQIAFMAGAVGVHHETHLGVNIFRKLSPDWMHAIFIILSDAGLAVFGGVTAYHSMGLVQFGWSTDIPMLNIPEGIRTLPMVICGGLIALFAGVRCIARLVEFLKHGALPIEGDLSKAQAEEMEKLE